MFYQKDLHVRIYEEGEGYSVNTTVGVITFMPSFSGLNESLTAEKGTSPKNPQYEFSTLFPFCSW
jgi:hypothetical protein